MQIPVWWGKIKKEAGVWNEKAYHDFAFAEVINYNKANLERVEQNEGSQQD